MLQHLLNNWFVSMDIQGVSAASVLLEGGVLAAVGLWCVRRRLRRKRGRKRRDEGQAHRSRGVLLIFLGLFVWIPVLMIAEIP